MAKAYKFERFATSVIFLRGEVVSFTTATSPSHGVHSSISVAVCLPPSVCVYSMPFTHRLGCLKNKKNYNRTFFLISCII